LSKSVLLVLLVCFNLYASSIESEKKIYKYLLHSIFPNKNIVKVWVDKKSKVPVLQNRNTEVVQNKNDADILLLFYTKELQTEKILFAGSYKVLKNYKNKAIGGFFWQKGRPNILFLKQNLEKEGVTLPLKLNKYIKEDL